MKEITQEGTKQRIWISDIVKDDYKKWNDTKVIFDAGTGSGKTHFIFNKLAAYAMKKNKTILYLCHRKPLYNKLLLQAKKNSNITLLLYQTLQSILRRGESTEQFDYIIADECHYILSDALFNEYTNLVYKYLFSQKDSVLILMSATSKTLFRKLKENHTVPVENIYHINKDYSYVRKVCFYKGAELTNIIDDIMEYSDSDKILVFVNSMQRLRDMYDTYGNMAYYMCSKKHEKKPEYKFCQNDCIINDSFDKRILFATKTLDAGIDIKDQHLKHIFTEIFDTDSALQAIGRKRPIVADDWCNFYFKDYDNRALLRFLEANNKQLEPARKYIEDRDAFINDLYATNQEPNQLARENRIMYIDWKDGEKIKINYVSYQKYVQEVNIIKEMISTSYKSVMLSIMGQQLSSKLEELELTIRQKDVFLEYLKEKCNCKLFKEDQQELKDKFKSILGLRDRTMGINTLNGKLVDCMYHYKLISKQETSRRSEHYKKRYWMIVETAA